ncbi:MAG: hypothetical protein FGM47_02225 [Candidatus Nanopelagicaceae bacterium]|nr:hypothetical protein [Candidatus Nanopelagicaceae bacterium]
MKIELTNQIKGLIFGMAFGDGLAAPSATNRLSILAPKRIMRMRSLSEFADENLHTTRPVPYTHAQPGIMLNPSPSDDSEWFGFVATYLLNGQSSEAAWVQLAAHKDQVRARTGTKIALKNLANGLLPPHSGHDNPHYFDDIALIRAVAVASIYFTNQHEMLAKVQEDITFTHSEDGLYCSQSIAVLFASILRGEGKSQAINNALQFLPGESWSSYLVADAMNKVGQTSNTFTRALILEEQFIENIYAYPISAPETLGLLLAHLSNTETAEGLINSTLLHKRKLDSLPPLAGALAGVLYGTEWLPETSLNESISLAGVCIPDLKGTKLLQLANAIIESHN